MPTDDSIARMRELFVAALKRDPEERSRFLDDACRDDPSLRAGVQSLLDVSGEANDYFDKPAWISLAGQETPAAAPSAQAGADPNQERGPEQDQEPAAEGEAEREPAVQEELEPDASLPFEKLGDFRLIRQLGEGGMGVVYLAMQESLDRPVALKVIRPERMGALEIARRFWREVEALCTLRHPNIATVFGSGEEKGVLYFAMELIPGAGLDLKLREARAQGATIPVPTALQWTAQIAQALESAHQAGIVHRDVKPSNIRITPENRAMLIDFGVARHLKLSTLTLTGAFRGTPYYAAPEQVKGAPRGIDGRADVYSLGATLYEIVTGRAPFEGGSTDQVFHQILAEEPIPPRRLNPSVSRDLQTVILTAMEKDFGRRYRDMASFAGDLQRLTSGVAIHAKPAGPGGRAWKWIRRNPGVSIAATVAALIAITFLGYVLLWSYPRLRQERNRAVLAGEEAERQRNAAQANARLALERYAEILRLSDIQRLDELCTQAGDLWPAHPERIPDLESWIAEAETLIGRKNLHLESLTALDGEGSAFETTETVWQRGILQELVAGLDALGAAQDGLLENVRGRLAFAETVEEATLDRYAAEWERVVASIADRSQNPAYGGLVIKPQLGLIPIGRDPTSGFWEFAHFQTGEVAERGSDEKLVLTEETGLVFVLIPGGSFQMGAVPPSASNPIGSPNVDPKAEKNEGPVHEATIEPFLMSKYEMTQGQWVRFTEENPSVYGPKRIVGGHPHNLLHPVENVSWEDCARVLSHLSLRLPFESEWEYTIRAGTGTRWWTGDDERTLEGVVNLADGYCKNNGGHPELRYELWLDDGFTLHAPVGSFKPNAFGLHDVCGNVFEWCQNAYGFYGLKPADANPLHKLMSRKKVYRGGAWNANAQYCRSADRNGEKPSTRFGNLGLRPACSLR